MANKHILKAEKRNEYGKSLNKFRAQGKVPGNIYGKVTEPTAVWFDKKELEQMLKEVNESALIEIMIDKEKSRPSILRNVQINPVKKSITHIDLQQVNLKEKIQVAIPIEFTGESEKATAGEAIIETHLSEVEVEALPTDLPEAITIDISGLCEVGDKITVMDIKIGKEVEIITDKEEVIVSLIEPQKTEEETPVVSEAEQVSEVETTEEANPAEEK